MGSLSNLLSRRMWSQLQSSSGCCSSLGLHISRLLLKTPATCIIHTVSGSNQELIKYITKCTSKTQQPIFNAYISLQHISVWYISHTIFCSHAIYIIYQSSTHLQARSSCTQIAVDYPPTLHPFACNTERDWKEHSTIFLNYKRTSTKWTNSYRTAESTQLSLIYLATLLGRSRTFISTPELGFHSENWHQR